MQVNNVFIFFLIFITVIIVSSSEELKDANQYYDRNSITQNEKLVRLFLRLAFQTANRVVELKNAARNQITSRLDDELQNLTLEDVINGQDKMKNDSSTEIQSRFLLPIDSKPLVHIFKSVTDFNLIPNQSENKVFNKTEDIIGLGSEIIHENAKKVSNFEINKTIDMVIDQSSTIINGSDDLLNIDNNNDVNNAEKVASQILNQIPAENDYDNVKDTIPVLRLLVDVTDENGTNVNGSEKAEKISENSTFSANDTSKKILVMKIRPSVLKSEEKIENQSQALPKIIEEKTSSVSGRNQDERSRRNIKEVDARPYENKSVDDMFKFSLEGSDEKYGPHLTQFMTKLKLQEIVDELSKTRK